MISERTFVIDLNVGSATTFAAHPEKAIMMQIRNIVGTCYQGAYVLRIAGIDDHSRVMFSNSVKGQYISVKFRAVCQTLGLGDILVGVEVAKRTGAIIGKYARAGEGEAAVVVQADAAASVVSVGMRIPVRVVLSQYDRQSMMQVVGRVLTCDTRPLTLHATAEALTPAELDAVRLLRDEVIGEYERRKRLSRDDVKFFETLLYAYRVGAEPAPERASGWVGPSRAAGGAGPGPGARVDMVAEMEALRPESGPGLSGSWSRPLDEYRSGPFAVRAPLARGVPTVRPGEACAKLLAHTHAWAKAVNDLVEEYDGKHAEHMLLWRAMRDAQLPAP